MLGQSESEIHLAAAEAGAGTERDHSTVRRGDGANHLALASERRQWERNLDSEQDKWRNWAF